jgi:transcriptional regulator with XRE-family HTH domain
MTTMEKTYNTTMADSDLPVTSHKDTIARQLTPAQKRAVALAQHQVLLAREAQRAQAARRAEILRLQAEQDRDFAAVLEEGRTAANNQHHAHQVEASLDISFRRVLGEVLRNLRQKDKKTLREVSQRAGVSLGYLSEVERGQKEASSELLGSITAALDMTLSQTLRLVADQIESLEKIVQTKSMAAQPEQLPAVETAVGR